MSKKLLGYNQLKGQIRNHSFEKIGLITGTFDILHLGHIQFMKQSRKSVDCLVVGISSDEFVRIHKGENRPIFPDFARAETVAALKDVDFVFIINDDIRFYSPNSISFLETVIQELGVSRLLLHEPSDTFINEKLAIANKLKVTTVINQEKKVYSTSEAINKIID